MKRTLLATSAILLAALPVPAHAEFKEDGLFDFDDAARWIIRGRLINVDADEEGGTSIGGSTNAVEAVVPEVDFTYFFTKHIAAELILATSPHKMQANNTAIGNVELGDVWVLPPTLTAQYHFYPDAQFRPYAGAGFGYIAYHGVNKSNQITDISYDDGFSLALQAGFDYGINDNWAFNVDVKRIFHNTEVSVNNGAVTADVDLEPWVFGVGLSYRF